MVVCERVAGAESCTFCSIPGTLRTFLFTSLFLQNKKQNGAPNKLLGQSKRVANKYNARNRTQGIRRGIEHGDHVQVPDRLIEHFLHGSLSNLSFAVASQLRVLLGWVHLQKNHSSVRSNRDREIPLQASIPISFPHGAPGQNTRRAWIRALGKPSSTIGGRGPR
jgi:hypothetical protein